MGEQPKIEINLVGPFSWPGLPGAPSIFTAEEGKKPGIYLWTVPQQQGELIYYVGETGRSFAQRMADHYKEHAAGFYHLYEPERFQRGEKVLVWPGHYDPTDRRTAIECIKKYLELTTAISALTSIYRFYLAPTACEDRLRVRIESAIAHALDSTPGVVGSFQDRNIRYRPIDRERGESPVSCVIEAPPTLLGIPLSLDA